MKNATRIAIASACLASFGWACSTDDSDTSSADGSAAGGSSSGSTHPMGEAGGRTGSSGTLATASGGTSANANSAGHGGTTEVSHPGSGGLAASGTTSSAIAAAGTTSSAIAAAGTTSSGGNSATGGWGTSGSSAHVGASAGSGSSSNANGGMPPATGGSGSGTSGLPVAGTTAIGIGGSEPGASGAASSLGGSGSIGGAGGNAVGFAGNSSIAGRSGLSGAAGSTQLGNTGGRSAAGASGGPSSQPGLITSGPGAYWQTGKLTATSANADITISDTKTYQDWTGFGGTFNEQGWDVLSLIDPSERDRALKLLFGSEGTHFVYGRIPIGASDYAMDRYTLDDTAGDYTMDHFSVERDKLRLIPYIQAALAIRADLHLWASPWTPPPWMKDNNSTDGGNMKSDAKTLQAHALYLSRFVEEYAKLGMKIEAIHPQNEPGYTLNYPSCGWTPSLYKTYIGTYLGPTFQARGLTTAIWCGTLSAPTDAQMVDAVLGDATASKYVKGIGAQWNQMNNVSGWISKYKATVWQTEHKCGNYPWDAKYNANKAPNDDAYAQESWGLIRDWIKTGVNAYSAWNMVLDTNGKNIDSSKPWPQNALMIVDRSTKKLTITPAYYVFRHLGQFVNPGAKRIDATGSSDALAFKNPDGSIVAVIYNSGAAKTVTLAARSAKWQMQIPATGWATVNLP